MSSGICFNLEQSGILLTGSGLKVFLSIIVQQGRQCTFTLPNDKILARSKFKAFADDKINAG